MSKRCFFVTGPEGSGNYMMAEALVEAGCCFLGASGNLREALEGCPFENIVVNRSIPSAGEFLDLLRVCDDIWWHGYDIVPVVMVREPNATIRSVQRRMPQDASMVKYNMKVAWQHIGKLAALMPIRPIPYEALVHSKEFQKWLFEEEFKLKYPRYTFSDQNRKYYV